MDKLIKMAKENIVNSYSPYSKFAVSAVLELKNGDTYKGVNIENAAFGLSNCAERSALFAAYSNGIKKEDIKKIVIFTDHPYFVSPCGSCRQVMRELMEDDADIILVNNKNETKTIKNSELLPFGFSKKDL
ncbi:MAG TPA: cytidine deaminase [Bacillota bacterium]|nr:cytidine deaminase [Bacillota bacterium]HPF42760.1 cytidine deaminase [Bacillota bacterium]HPJ85976.1 cytidine deaminase [Bacillota bacterium]HPQ62003.1 cytidine deaminase [Bacillota bacterium]HRX92007.1 cytidine deaminase [Candidatus Izemoplasmatales bacterium]